MLTNTAWLLAAFTAPEDIKMNPQSMLWMLPLAAAIAIVYKAIKLPRITLNNFLKETFLLFASIIVFVIVASAVLWFAIYLAIE
jgi:hypothetical protein